jgi:pyruvate,water dikinase
VPVPLDRALDERLFGGKAVSLGAALRHGLPVPPGVALSVPFVHDVASGREDAVSALIACEHLPSDRAAVRSSAVGEDSRDASFAGQHATHLNVGRLGLPRAVSAVWASGRSDAALAYRAQRGIGGEPAVAVVVQRLVRPRAAGVLFTRNPMTGADERVIEAAWGLGEVVVSGRVVPDHVRLDAAGRVLELIPGDKDVRIEHEAGDGVREVPVAEPERSAPCLSSADLDGLFELSNRCRTVWGPDLDLEWAIDEEGRCFLLQSRPITTRLAGA